MRLGVLNAVSGTETPFQTPFNTVFDNYGFASSAKRKTVEMEQFCFIAMNQTLGMRNPGSLSSRSDTVLRKTDSEMRPAVRLDCVSFRVNTVFSKIT